MNELKSTEDQLRAEIESLKQQLDEKRRSGHSPQPAGPSRGRLLLLGLILAALIVAGFFKGYLPRQKREMVLAAETKADAESLPVVNVQPVKRSAAVMSLLLPGNIQAIAEGPVMARATGYIRKRNVDIGDRVEAGQALAEIEAPELKQQIAQARAAVEQANSTVEQAGAALEQGRTNANLARVTSERWNNLFAKGVVSRQERDTYQAQYEAQQANVQALEKAIAAARGNSAAAAANVDRLNQLLSYQTVRAPFAGVITVRNVDTGALVNEGNTMLFRIAQTGRLRTYVNVPQAEAGSVRVGQQATLTIPDLPGRKFVGTVSRTSNALDPSSRTLLVELQVPNADSALLPGMYAQVDLALPRRDPPLVIPGDTLVVRPDGPQVAVVASDGAVHFARVQLGRDFGDRLEVLSGLEEGQKLVVNPSDSIREGARVKPVSSPERAEKR
jgi:RND family efflux transporter MFP subunit